MQEDTETPAKPRRPRATGRKNGRPTMREAELRRLAEFDARLVLVAIAQDATAPAGSRVSACRTLLGLAGDGQPLQDDGLDGLDDLSRRAVARMRRPPDAT